MLKFLGTLISIERREKYLKVKRMFWKTLIATLILCTLAVGMLPVQAPATGTLALSPETITVQTGSEPAGWPNFDIDVKITNVTDVVAIVVSAHWNASVLDLTNVVKGDFLDDGFTPGPTIDHTAGNLKEYAITQLPPYVPKTYTDPDWGLVATLKFKFVGTPPSAGENITTTITLVDDPNADMDTMCRSYGEPVTGHNFAVLGTCEFTYAGPPAVHDVAVINVSAPAEATQGDDITINVNVTNLGNVPETFTVEVSYDITLIDTQPVTLVLGDSTTIPFSWETAGVALGLHTITAEAILAGDANLINNNATTTILIKPPPGAIDGTVTDTSTGLPIDGASITANSYTTTTDEYGYYTIADVPPGDYTVEASVAGYFSDSKPAHVESFATTTVNFTLTQKVHDLNITDVVPSATQVDVGAPVDIDVIVKNEGNVEESFTLKLYAESDLVETKTLTLAAGATQTYTFTWTTTAIGNFTIRAHVPPVSGEDDTDDNDWTTTLWRIQVIPEFPSFTLLPILIIATLAAAILAKRAIKQRHSSETARARMRCILQVKGDHSL